MQRTNAQISRRKKVEAPALQAGAFTAGASRSVQGPPASASSAVPSQSIVAAPSD